MIDAIGRRQQEAPLDRRVGGKIGLQPGALPRLIDGPGPDQALTRALQGRGGDAGEDDDKATVACAVGHHLGAGRAIEIENDTGLGRITAEAHLHQRGAGLGGLGNGGGGDAGQRDQGSGRGEPTLLPSKLNHARPHPDLGLTP
jgi:hypothetical protein